MTDAIPASVRELLDRHLPSIDHVELLLLLAGDETRSWTAQDAAASVHGQVDPVQDRLREMVDASILAFEAESSTYRYAARRTMRESVTQLATLYNQRPVTLIRAIYDRRSVRPRSFRDAFSDPLAEEVRRRTTDSSNGTDG